MQNKIDISIINRLFEHKSFPNLIRFIKYYFEDSLVEGVMAHNEIIDLATVDLTAFLKENPKHIEEGRKDLQILKTSKAGKNEAELEKIKTTLLSILKDIKRDIENDVPVGETASAEFTQNVWAKLKHIPQHKIRPEDVVNAIIKLLRQTGEVDDENEKAYRQVFLSSLKKKRK